MQELCGAHEDRKKKKKKSSKDEEEQMWLESPPLAH